MASFTAESIGAEVISLFDAFSSQYVAASQQARDKALATNLAFSTDSTPVPTQAGRTISMILTTANAPSTVPPGTGVQIDFGVASDAIDALVAAGQLATNPIATLAFDVALESSDGLAQSIEYTSLARQTIHQTANGFYLDEFGLAPGELRADVEVIFRFFPDQRIQKFFDLLDKAKMATPLAPTPPSVLTWHDTYLGRSYIITQKAVSVTQSSEVMNCARIHIEADILQDLSTNTSDTPQTTTTGSSTSAVQTSLLSYQLPAVAGGEFAIDTSTDNTAAGAIAALLSVFK